MRHIYFLIYIIYLFLIVSLIFFDKRKPMKRFGWILILVFLPGLGLLLYWFIGSDTLSKYNKRKIQQRHGDTLDQLEEIISDTQHNFVIPSSKNILFHRKYCNSIYTDDNDIEIYTTGAEKYRQLFKDIESAKSSIHIIYFTIHNDNTGKRFIELLTKKALEGVEVKLLYDSFGCITSFLRPLTRNLRKAGGKVFSIRPYTRAINYRNHRKIVIIDGKIGYLGGMNIGDHYEFGVRGMKWRDTHIRVTGSIVHDLQRVFISDWTASVKREDIGFHRELSHYFPIPIVKGNLKGQIVANGLYNNNNDEIINMSYFNQISRAQKRVWIQTPYFRPSATILRTLKTLAILGIDVQIMVSLSYSFGGIFNRSLNRFFLRHLMDSGIKVYEYKDIMHGKTMIIDDYGLNIGTVNINTRSLQIDDEIYGYFESESLVREYEEIFKEDVKCCIELDNSRLKNQSLIEQAIESVLSFLAPFS